MEQVVVELYRTNEDRDNHTFTACVTISYFGDTAFIQGLDDTLTIQCWREIRGYLESKGIKQAQYFRKGRLKTIT